MNSTQIIIAFLELLKNERSPLPPEALRDLPELDKNLPEQLDDIHTVADAILDWCHKHQLIKPSGEERGIKFPPPQNPASQELDKTNIYEIYRELKQQVKTQSQNPQPPSQKP